METNEQLLNKLVSRIDACESVLVNPTTTRKTLKEHADNVFGTVSVCNKSLKHFSDEERKRFEVIYDRAMNIAGRANRFAALMKWEGA